MKPLLSMLFILLLTPGCGRTPDQAQSKYDSYHSLALTGTIQQGWIKTTATADPDIKSEIFGQLRYAIGQLNGLDSVGDHANSLAKSMTITDKKALPGGAFLVSYSAKMTISWSRGLRIPGVISLILPESVNASFGMPQKYFDRYAVPACLDAAAHSLSSGNFWYYIRPYQKRCSLGRGQMSGDLTARVPMRLAISPINTEGQSPEYQKFWEDGRLIVTAAFSTYAPTNDASDFGVRQYGAFYNNMVATFGRPTYSSVDIPGNGPGLGQPSIQLEFKSSQGPIQLHMYLVEGLTGNGAVFDRQFSDATLTSDIIMYHGHAGLGSNVRGLAQKIRAQKDQYHLIMINSCDTFAYIDDTLMLTHKTANPDAPDYKFVDIITNAMPSSFGAMADAAMVIMRSAVTMDQTYRQLLSRLDGNQHASVMGEEDND
jgi:hypothetical protein